MEMAPFSLSPSPDQHDAVQHILKIAPDRAFEGVFPPRSRQPSADGILEIVPHVRPYLALGSEDVVIETPLPSHTHGVLGEPVSRKLLIEHDRAPGIRVIVDASDNDVLVVGHEHEGR